jgi:hypothetical protein
MVDFMKNYAGAKKEIPVSAMELVRTCCMVLHQVD